ncbi:MAG: NADH-quinone oxidoreductase subunit J [Elusimicrobiota bacterium]
MNIYILAGLVIFSIFAVFTKDLLKAAISLAVASIFLAIMFFRMGAAYAGVFEVSVVAGLITVLFITVIALTKEDSQVQENRWPLIVFPVLIILFVLGDMMIIRKFIGDATPYIPAMTKAENFGDTFWTKRTYDILGQVGVIFAGVFGVFALLKRKKQ